MESSSADKSCGRGESKFLGVNIPAWLPLCLMLLWVGILAWTNAFIQDDAFITLRYVQNAVNGHGLRWQPGSTEFGYTNFLFAVLLVLPGLLGHSLVCAIQEAGFISGLASAALMYFLFGRHTRLGAPMRALAVAAIFSVYTVSAYFTGGMETSFQGFLVLVTAAIWLETLQREPSIFWAAALSTAAGLAILTRLDTALVLVPIGLSALIQILRRRAWRALYGLVLPIAVLLAAYVVYTWSSYGVLFPNTALVKIGGPQFKLGVFFFSLFLENDRSLILILMIGSLAALILRLLAGDRKMTLAGVVLLAGVALHMLYVFYIGGGFMWFRLLYLPLVLGSFVAFMLLGRQSESPLMVGFCLVAIAINVYQAFFPVTRSYMETPEILNNHVSDNTKNNWRYLGEQLGLLLDTDKGNPVVISTSATGAIPFYSNLPVVDEIGLNTRWVAKNAPDVVSHPGHRMRATREQLWSLGVNLSFSQPYILCGQPKPQPGEVWLKLDNDCFLRAYYLNLHPRVEDLIEQDRAFDDRNSLAGNEVLKPESFKKRESEFFELKGLTTVLKLKNLPQLMEVKENGTGWNDGTLVLHGPVLLVFPEREISSVEFSVDSNDTYRISFIHEGMVIGERILDIPPRETGGLINEEVLFRDAKIIDSIYVEPFYGDGKYSLGHLVFR